MSLIQHQKTISEASQPGDSNQSLLAVKSSNREIQIQKSPAQGQKLAGPSQKAPTPIQKVPSQGPKLPAPNQITLEPVGVMTQLKTISKTDIEPPNWQPLPAIPPERTEMSVAWLTDMPDYDKTCCAGRPVIKYMVVFALIVIAACCLFITIDATINTMWFRTFHLDSLMSRSMAIILTHVVMLAVVLLGLVTFLCNQRWALDTFMTLSYILFGAYMCLLLVYIQTESSESSKESLHNELWMIRSKSENEITVDNKTSKTDFERIETLYNCCELNLTRSHVLCKQNHVGCVMALLKADDLNPYILVTLVSALFELMIMLSCCFETCSRSIIC